MEAHQTIILTASVILGLEVGIALGYYAVEAIINKFKQIDRDICRASDVAYEARMFTADKVNFSVHLQNIENLSHRIQVLEMLRIEDANKGKKKPNSPAKP